MVCPRVVCGDVTTGRPALDYIRHYGDSAIAGLQLVGAITKLNSEVAMSVITPKFLSLIPGFFATNVGDRIRSLESLLRMCFPQEPLAEDLYLMLGYNVSVPADVRQALLSQLG